MHCKSSVRCRIPVLALWKNITSPPWALREDSSQDLVPQQLGSSANVAYPTQALACELVSVLPHYPQFNCGHAHAAAGRPRVYKTHGSKSKQDALKILEGVALVVGSLL